MRRMSQARRERLLRALDAVREEFVLGGVTYTFDPRQADKRPAISAPEPSR